MKYINKITGIEIETICICEGADWELISETTEDIIDADEIEDVIAEITEKKKVRKGSK